MTPSMSPSLIFIVLAFHACIVSADDIDTSNSAEGAYDEEIKCYNLPYGGFGFFSHVLTYYTMTLLCMGRRPLPPWSELEATEWNITLAIAKLICTSVPCIYTMVKCSHSW
ncbi:hypothetical protein N7494_004186 [Penicillium frequentans]|uniref:Uncharacterized protein n=1 Tax=Penicillium frequentans TaxID=3151616 RepID=A0AAD6GI72_9EURO|nr:hypothetical protein N7494_004186 [Penicillium glabrum]